MSIGCILLVLSARLSHRPQVCCILGLFLCLDKVRVAAQGSGHDQPMPPRGCRGVEAAKAKAGAQLCGWQLFSRDSSTAQVQRLPFAPLDIHSITSEGDNHWWTHALSVQFATPSSLGLRCGFSLRSLQSATE